MDIEKLKLRESYERGSDRNNSKGLKAYKLLGSEFPLITDTYIEGDVTPDLNAWNLHPNREKFMKTITDFKQYVRKLSSNRAKTCCSNYFGRRTGPPGPGINIPILQTGNDHGYGINDLYPVVN